MKKTPLLMLFITLCVVMTSCQKEDLLNDNGQNSSTDRFRPKMFTVKLTDAPGVYGAVYIDIKGVEATLNTGEVVQLNTNDRRYNLRTFTNGRDTVIATGLILSGATVTQLKLILGPNSTVVSAGQTYAMTMNPGDEEGLEVPIQTGRFTLNASNGVLLDFDANQSVIDMGNNHFRLRPVIRYINPYTSGTIQGKITPVGLMASITATSMYGTYSTFAEDQSEFKILGVPSGKYTITIIPNIPLSPTTINNVVVNRGTTTDLGTFTF